MHTTARLLGLFALLSLAACASHSAYGPAGDDRLDEDSSGRKAPQALDANAMMSLNCKEQEKAVQAANTETDERKKLITLGKAYEAAKATFTQLDEASSSQTDLLYGKEGDQIKANLEGCREASASAYSAFDGFVRELVDMPVVQEMQDRKMINVARVEFATLRTAIDKLGATDREVLLNKLAAVEPSLGQAI
ncbi:MAG: hypothetical protein LBM75_06710 [Myxococcales bacterium]|jgi:hypothetical protein|nr:hypothetical protein [Myxococcales bacterium]